MEDNKKIDAIMRIMKPHFSFDYDDYLIGGNLYPVAKALFEAGYVKLAEDQTIDIPDEIFFSQEARRCGFTKRSFSEAGWQKVILKEKDGYRRNKNMP